MRSLALVFLFFFFYPYHLPPRRLAYPSHSHLSVLTTKWEMIFFVQHEKWKLVVITRVQRKQSRKTRFSHEARSNSMVDYSRQKQENKRAYSTLEYFTRARGVALAKIPETKYAHSFFTECSECFFFFAISKRKFTAKMFFNRVRYNKFHVVHVPCKMIDTWAELFLFASTYLCYLVNMF